MLYELYSITSKTRNHHTMFYVCFLIRWIVLCNMLHCWGCLRGLLSSGRTRNCSALGTFASRRTIDCKCSITRMSSKSAGFCTDVQTCWVPRPCIPEPSKKMECCRALSQRGEWNGSPSWAGLLGILYRCPTLVEVGFAFNLGLALG